MLNEFDVKAYVHSWLAVMVLAFATLAVAVVASQPARAAGPWYVASGGNDSNSCLSPAAACASINGVLNKPGFVAGDTIRVATGTYTGSGDEVVSIHKDVTLSGGWDVGFTMQSGMSTIDGQGMRMGIVVYYDFFPATALIERFTVQNGYSYPFSNIGGGISIGGNLTLNNSIVRNNASEYGGGGIDNIGTLTLTNSTVSGNVARLSSSGGGIRNWAGGSLIVNNSTISDNMADADGGGIFSQSGTVIVRNTILAGNTASGSGPDCQGAITSLSYNLIGNTSGCTFSAGTGDLLNVDAKLVPLADWLGFFPLRIDSPAIDAGNPAGCVGSAGLLTTDQRGISRIGRCDIGAYEHTTPGPAANILAISGTPQNALIFSAFNAPFQAAVLDSVGSPVTTATVTFSAPTTGASGTFMDSGTFTTTAVTDEGGIATAGTFTANGMAGSYTVAASVSGITDPARFMLTNTARVFLPALARNFCADFFDDFGNLASGWPVGEDDLVRVEYLNGEYRILSKSGDYIYLFRSPSCDRENYVVEVDARWVGTPGLSYGIVFGITSGFGQYYLFDVSADFQDYLLARRDPGGFTLIVPPTFSPAINGGTATNHLKVTRNGSQITLEVNGTVLGSWFDNVISGSTGAGVYSNPYIDLPVSDARFDNFLMASLSGSGLAVQRANALPKLELPFVPIERIGLPAHVDRLPFRDDLRSGQE